MVECLRDAEYAAIVGFKVGLNLGQTPATQVTKLGLVLPSL
jgi:hypothetical protein